MCILRKENFLMSDFRVRSTHYIFRESSQRLQNARNLMFTKNNILKATAMQIK